MSAPVFIDRCAPLSFSNVDEIVLSYVLSILEDLGDGSSPEEDVDVDQFVEVMDAYIPGFGDIDR